MGQLHTTIGAAIIVLAIAGCGGERHTLRQEPEQDKNAKEPLSYYEATLRPSEFDEDVDVVQKASVQTGKSVNIDFPSDSTVVEEVKGQGFRIQIFASSNIDEANSAKMVAAQRLPRDSVYVVYDPPVYKVRVGDFPTRLEANQHLSQLINIGYPDAWVVTDRITRRTVVRISKEQ